MALLRSAQHRLTALALAGALALGVSGCGDDSPTPAPSTSSAAASPTPTASGPVAPVLPDLAARHDDVGAKAFVKYWFAAVTFAMRSGDTEPFMAVSATECKSCDAMRDHIADLESRGIRLAGGGWDVLAVDVDPKSAPPYYRIAVKIKQPAQRLVGANGKTVDSSPESLFLFYAGVRETNGGHELVGLERIDD